MPGKLSDDRDTANIPMLPPTPTSSFTLEDLAWKCTKNAIAVSQYLSANDLPQPSHEADGPSRTLPRGAPPTIQKARQSLMDAALQLFQLAAGPNEFVPNLAPGIQYVACLDWLLRHNIFHLVPTTGTTTYADLAAAASVPEARLRSIARMAMTTSLFREPQPGRLGHSATSALMARDADVRAWASYLATRSAPTALAMADAHARFSPSSTADNETAYNVAFGTHLPFFEHLARDPGATDVFAGYMRNVTTSEALDVAHLVGGYPWAEEVVGTGNGTGALVVDVGGSTGNAAIALARRFARLRVVVQDLPANAEAGRAAAAAMAVAAGEGEGGDVFSRVTFQAHDFMTPQPVAGADVYLLRMILHDWPDRVAVEILRNLVPVLAGTTAGRLGDGGDGCEKEEKKRPRLVIMDTVLPAPGRVPVSVERVVRVRDMTMMQVFNSHERDLDQWRALLASADGRLRLRRVLEPFGSAMALLEVEMEMDGELQGESVGDVDEDEDEEEGWDISG